jgi:septum formation protein
MKKIILASASPRRRELLSKIGLKFSIEKSNIREDLDLKLNPKQLAEMLSYRKACKISKKYSNAVIIAADTLVVLNNKIIGKPKNPKDAAKILNKLSGKAHSVITAFTIIDTKTNKSVTKSVETKVFMKKLTEEEIKYYVNTEEPSDKAGAYAIQGFGGIFIEKIDGDYYNVVGLPLTALIRELKKFGIHVL